jgi:uncharacterized membrane protein required for colicin V production
MKDSFPGWSPALFPNAQAAPCRYKIQKILCGESALTVLDVVILLVIAACAVYGARAGLIRELSHIVAFGLGLLLAVKLHSTAAQLLLYKLPPGTASVAAFVGLLIVVIGVVYILFSYAKESVDGLKLGPADHVTGAVFGAVQGALICSLIIFLLVNFSSSLPAAYLKRSTVASFLLDRSNRVTEAFSSTSVSRFTSIFGKHGNPEVVPVEKQQTRTSDVRIIKPKRPAAGSMNRSGKNPAAAPDSTGGQTERPQAPCLNSTDNSSCAPEREGSAAARARDYRVVHVFVALCDNRNQGIVPVPKELGDGQNPRSNLYWGALYGVWTFLRRSSHWQEVDFTGKPRSKAVLQRCVFKSSATGTETYIVADAYDGSRMRTALTDFFRAAAGLDDVEVAAGSMDHSTIKAGGGSDMVCFVGHNGLMDLTLSSYPENSGRANPDCAVVLACRSNSYFAEPLRKAACRPLIMTSGLMAPEAYTLDAIIRSWAAGDSPAETRRKAAEVYSEYQKTSKDAAIRLFVACKSD